MTSIIFTDTSYLYHLPATLKNLPPHWTLVTRSHNIPFHCFSQPPLQWLILTDKPRHVTSPPDDWPSPEFNGNDQHFASINEISFADKRLICSDIRIRGVKILYCHSADITISCADSVDVPREAYDILLCRNPRLASLQTFHKKIRPYFTIAQSSHSPENETTYTHIPNMFLSTPDSTSCHTFQISRKGAVLLPETE